MSSESEDAQKGILWRLYATSRKGLPVSITLPYCGHETTKDRLEGKLWEYAEGGMSEAEVERFWEQTQGCKYCLQKLLSIQQAINRTSEEKGYSLGRINKLIKQKSGSNVLQIALNWVKDSLELLSTTGLMLTPEPVPAIRGKAPVSPQIIRITKKFERCRVEVEIQKMTSRTCNLEIKIEPGKVEAPITGLRISLLANKKLLASYIAHEGRAVFNDIDTGHYRVTITKDGKLVGGVLLDIE